jgi:hypothetical protein
MAKNYRHTLIYNGVPKVLTDVSGWGDIEKKYIRHGDYHGIFPIDESGFKFLRIDGVKDTGGYQFILDAFNAEDIRAEIEYKRERKDRLINKWVIDYTGVMKLTPESGFVINISERWIEAKIIVTSKLESFFANDEKNFELDTTTAINGNAITAFLNHPIPCTYPKLDLFIYALTASRIYDDEFTAYITNKTVLYRYFGYNPDPNYLGTDKVPENSHPIYTNTGDDTLTVKFILNGSYTTSYTYTPLSTPENSGVIHHDFLIEKTDASPQTFRYFEIVDNEDDITVQTVNEYSGTFSDEQTVTVEAGGTIDIYSDFTTSGMDDMRINLLFEITIDQFDIIEVYEGAPTNRRYPQNWFPHEILQRSIQVLTGETDTSKLAYSVIFGRTDAEFQPQGYNGTYSLLGTCGGNVLKSGYFAKTKINFKDWFRTIDRIGSIAFWYDKDNDRFRVEKKEEVYRDEQILDIGTVSNYKVYPSKEAYVSQQLTGSREKGEYDKLQGVNEYNIQTEHSADFPVKDKIDLRTIYNTDSVGIAYQLRSVGQDGIKDSEQDIKVYITDFKSDYTARINSEVGSIDGFMGLEDYYNGNLTPRKCLKNQQDWLASMFYKDSNRGIHFRTNTKDINVKIGSNYEQDELTNLADNGDEVFYYPEIIECEGVGSTAMIEQLDSDPHGYVKFTDATGTVDYMYILEARIQAYNRKAFWKGIKANIDR